MTVPSKTQRGRAAEHRGRWAEMLCVVRLWLTGWRIVARRLAGKRGSGVGEIDLVAVRGNTLAFIEVKARTDAVAALDSIQAPQRERIQTAAAAFLAARPQYGSHPVRFDAMILDKGLWPVHVPDAWRVF
ncbi:MAG: YraN family protein [Rhodospirillaceae bacterium]|nr:YraN family protein [Rhodospirillaceae bacterium]